MNKIPTRKQNLRREIFPKIISQGKKFFISKLETKKQRPLSQYNHFSSKVAKSEFLCNGENGRKDRITCLHENLKDQGLNGDLKISLDC